MKKTLEVNREYLFALTNIILYKAHENIMKVITITEMQ